MLRTHLRDELALMLRTEMMTSDEVAQAIETAHLASFLADEPAPLEAALPGAPIALEVEV